MSSVAVQKLPKSEATAPFFKHVDELFQAIRQRAFSFFAERGFSDGQDLEDWLNAEHEILWSPPLDLIENEKEFRIRVAAPGFKTKEIQITALPSTVFIEAQSEQKEDKVEGKAHISELGSRKLYRRVDVPSAIDVEKTTATLDDGVLELIAAKAAQPKEHKVPVVRAAA